jgi:hypothetical protein
MNAIGPSKTMHVEWQHPYQFMTNIKNEEKEEASIMTTYLIHSKILTHNIGSMHWSSKC